MKAKLVLLVLTIFGSINLYSQIYGGFGTALGYGFNNYSADTSFSTLITQTDISLGKDFSENFQIFGNFSYINFAEFSDRNFLAPEIGFSYSNMLMDEVSLNMDFGSSFRLGSKEYNYFNYLQPIFNLSFAYNFDESSSVAVNSSNRYKNYLKLNDFDFVENLNNLSFRKSFESKTTISTSLSFNNKTYMSNYESYIADDVLSVAKGKGMGKGYMGNWNMGNMGNSGTTTDTIESGDTTYIVNYKQVGAKTTTQFKYAVNIAQNIFESTGISANFQQGFIISDFKSEDFSSVYDFATDDDLYDDPFMFDFTKFSGKITQMLPFDFKLQLNYSFTNKQYYFGANDENPQIMRNDNVYNYGLSLEKSIDFEELFINSVSFNFDYSYINNKSNNLYFDYNYSFLMFGINVGF